MDNRPPYTDDFDFFKIDSDSQSDDPFSYLIDRIIVDDHAYLNDSSETQNILESQSQVHTQIIGGEHAHLNESSETSNILEAQSQTFHPMKEKVKRKPPEFVPITPYSLRFINLIRFIIFGDITIKPRKEVVMYYHELVSERNPEVPKLSRDIKRNFNKYYFYFACIQDKILSTLQILKNEGFINYQEDYARIVSKKNL